MATETCKRNIVEGHKAAIINVLKTLPIKPHETNDILYHFDRAVEQERRAGKDDAIKQLIKSVETQQANMVKQ